MPIFNSWIYTSKKIPSSSMMCKKRRRKMTNISWTKHENSNNEVQKRFDTFKLLVSTAHFIFVIGRIENIGSITPYSETGIPCCALCWSECLRFSHYKIKIIISPWTSICSNVLQNNQMHSNNKPITLCLLPMSTHFY